MDKLSKITGFASGDKKLDVLHTKTELEKKKKTYNSVNLSKLPDKGAKLKNQIDELENLLNDLSLETDIISDDKTKKKDSNSAPLSVDENKAKITAAEQSNEESESVTDSDSDHETSDKSASSEKENIQVQEVSNTLKSKAYLSFRDLTPKQSAKTDIDNVMNSPSFKVYREPGEIRRTMLTEAKPLLEKSVPKGCMPKYFSSSLPFQANEECVKKIHNSLETYPDDSKEESDPENLRSTLMMHQRKGLAWLMWREQQDPSGGILADDMGLGKTLSMISLILKQKERGDYSSFNEEDYECRGTLIICVASLIHQWNEEIRKHCEFNALKVLVYHGPKRDRDVKRMMSYDVVLTTYNIIMSERKAADSSKVDSPLFKLKWERIVLDEAHTIKNHASQTAQAIFCLHSFRKWAITGTPIHNVFKDMYSLVKFLEFSPFDDLKKFKGLTDDSSESSEQRRNLLMKSLVLRRTKEEVDEWGKPLIEMKKKSFSLIYIELSDEERKIYEKLNEKVGKKINHYLEKTLKLRSGSSLLVMLLRLQQCCNHPSLLGDEIEDSDDPADVANTLSSLTLDENLSDSNTSLDSGLDLTFTEIKTEKISDKAVKSSKIRELFNVLSEISKSSGGKDKSVIVSQWVSMLEIVKYHLEQDNIPFHLIAGNTKVEDRQKFAKDFNYNDNGPKIMLLSLKAGGVGLNLIGANHLFLLDLHWNPALEMQACDRIHRVGQKKDVTIYKFICKNTIEEKINELQNCKRRVASSALHGTKQNTKGLTIEDFKMLFRIKK